MLKPTFEELLARIQEIAHHCGGKLPQEQATAWSGYIAALLEYSIITPEIHQRLQAFLGREAAACAIPIFLGPAGAPQTKERRISKKRAVDPTISRKNSTRSTVPG